MSEIKYPLFIYLRKNINHISVAVLCGLVIIFNLTYKDRSLEISDEQSDYLLLDERSANTLEEIASFTNFNEDIEQIRASIDFSLNQDYLSKNDKDSPLNTEASQLERTYTVQKGDSITTIAKRFNIHVATILDRNSISSNEIEKIKAGDQLIIPATDTSNSKQWLADLNYQKEQERQKQLAIAKKKQEEAAKKKLLASKNRSVVTRDSSSKTRASSGFSGSFAGGFIVPISHNGISRGLQSGHYGIDYRANVGIPVHAAAAGKVIELTDGWGGGFGKSVLIDHGSGTTTRYAHLSSFSCSSGDYVDQGQTVGLSGNTGFSTGPHLHFETRVYGTAINPF